MAAGRVSHARHGCYPLDDYDPAAPAAVKARPAMGWAARGRLNQQPPGLDGRRTAGYGVPANSYLSICGQGYRFFGFPVDKLLEACRYSRERMKHHEGR